MCKFPPTFHRHAMMIIVGCHNHRPIRMLRGGAQTRRVDVAGIRLWEKRLTMLFYGVIYGWVKVMQKMWKIVVVEKRHPLLLNVRNDYLLPQHNWSENESILIVPGSRLLGCALQKGVCLRTGFPTTIITLNRMGNRRQKHSSSIQEEVSPFPFSS